MAPSNDLAAEVVMTALEENLPEPNRNWPADIFEEQSYARWAAYELANRLMDRPYEFVDNIIQDFILEMSGYLHQVRDPQKERLFRVAIDTAEDILTLF